MTPHIPCEICTTPIPSTHRRYGGKCCNACASFFTRSIPIQEEYVCKSTSDCLITASLLGKGCRRCRFDKCLEIGMSTTGMGNIVLPQQPQQPPPPQQLPQQPPVQTITAPVAAPKKRETAVEKATVFAKIVDSTLNAAIKNPILLKEYLEHGKQDIITTSFKKVETADITKMIESEYLLAILFLRFSISQKEFPIFLRLLICKVEVNWIPDVEQTTIKLLQSINISTLGNFNVNENRLNELKNVSKHFINIFNIYH
uniref:Nuclear receptor domain-containing protein n=1 Tax=Panagrolaimus davidi TaxID=227884 RepID=A0A914PDH2_9BILA